MSAPYSDPSIFEKMELREGDVFVSTGGKQGTTWSCYIVQQLLSHGNNDFQSLLEIAPWAEYVYYPGESMEERLKRFADMPRDQRRSFKTHIAPPVLPLDPRVKYVICVRNPLDSIASFLPFINMHSEEFCALWDNFPPKFSGWDDFMKFMENMELYWSFVNPWWPHRFDKNVFMMHYSELKNKPFETIKKLAEFLVVVDSSDAFVSLVAERSSFENMKKNEEKFELILAGKNKDIPVLKSGAMMRKGQVAGGGKEVPAYVREAIDKQAETSCLNEEQLDWCKNGGEIPK